LSFLRSNIRLIKTNFDFTKAAIEEEEDLVEIVTDGSDNESHGETFILDRLAKEARRSVSGSPEVAGSSVSGNADSEKRKKERPIEIKRVHDSKDNRVRLTKPLVVSHTIIQIFPKS
jgi:hypothetical protein